MKQIFSLHKIKDAKSFDFNAENYSKFKFGDTISAKLFGEALAKEFIESNMLKLYKNTQLVVISSPYSFIPTATFTMKNYFVNFLNRWLVENDFLVVQETKVGRSISYKDDYGNLSAEDRIALIGNDKFNIDVEFIKGKVLIFLDDIKITGGHEKMILKMVDYYKLKNEIYLLYFAELVNNNINPNFENYLNYFSVKSILDLKPIIESKNFEFNTRIVKYILHAENNLFKKFIEFTTHEFKNKLYDLAIGNTYHNIKEYEKNLKHLKTLI